MKEKRAEPVHFRPTQANRQRLDDAVKLGFEMTEVLNGLLEVHLDPWIKQSAKNRIAEMQKVLAAR